MLLQFPVLGLLALAPLVTAASRAPIDQSSRLADTYVKSIEKLNADHARKPGETTESELSTKLPKKALTALEKLLESEDGEELGAALERCAKGALELDRTEDFAALRAKLAKVDAARADALGVALSRERVLLFGQGGLSQSYLEDFAPIIEDVLAAYDEVFGFHEFSKVPGKKLRIRLHLEDEIKRPPHFAPQFPYHSEIDFPVIDDKRFSSPTSKGQFLFYGLCHELGHVIAMWGNQSTEEDHHAWAHYTGLVIVQHLASSKKAPDWIEHCRDLRWRSVDLERERLGDTEAGLDDRDQVLALLLALHDTVGPEAIGKAINALDEKDSRLRINHVRYYSFRELRKSLASVLKSKSLKKKVEALFP